MYDFSNHKTLNYVTIKFIRLKIKHFSNAA